jgi:hypothetical protein
MFAATPLLTTPFHRMFYWRTNCQERQGWSETQGESDTLKETKKRQVTLSSKSPNSTRVIATPLILLLLQLSNPHHQINRYNNILRKIALVFHYGFINNCLILYFWR